MSGDLCREELDLSAKLQSIRLTESFRFPFISLPRELQFVTLQFLDSIELIQLSTTCKQLNELCNEPAVWKGICTRTWPEIDQNTVKWKQYYYQRLAFLSKNTMEWRSREVVLNNAPTARQSLTGNCVKGKIVYIGGQTSVTMRFDDIFYFDVDKRVFKKPKILGHPPKFARHAAVEVGNKIYVFGGYDGFGQFYGLSVFDVDTETWYSPDVKGVSPTPRTNHTITSVDSKIYLFGGNDTTRADSNNSYLKFGTYSDFQVLDTETMTWYEPETKGKKPCARSGHHMVSVGNKIYIFGGGLWNDKNKTWIEKYNDMHVFDVNTNEWREIEQLCPNSQAFISLPHWKVGYFIFVFHDPLWCFDTVTNVWHIVATKGNKPHKRFLGPGTAVPQKHCAYMFGGVYQQVMNHFDQLSWPSNIFEILSFVNTEEEKTKLEKPLEQLVS